MSKETTQHAATGAGRAAGNAVSRADAMLQSFDPGTLTGAITIAAILFAVGLILTWIVHRTIRSALHHDHGARLDTITVSFVSRLAILFLWLVLLTFYAHLIPALHRVGNALLAGVSLVSVVVGFAAQTTLSNLVAGISLVLYKPFRQGDRLQIGAPTSGDFAVGTVETISLGYTSLRTDAGEQIVIANGTMAQQTFIRLAPGEAGATPAPAATDKP